MTPWHHGRPGADRVAAYLDGKAPCVNERASQTDNNQRRSRAMTRNAAASDIRARPFEA